MLEFSVVKINPCKDFTLTVTLCRFAKEQNFTLQQISAFFTLLKEMLDNIKGKNNKIGNNEHLSESPSLFKKLLLLRLLYRGCC